MFLNIQWLRAYAAIIVVFGMLAAGAVSAQTIVVQGNQRVDAETVRSYFTADPGARVDQAAIDRGVRDMLATGLFRNVRARPFARVAPCSWVAGQARYDKVPVIPALSHCCPE